MNDTIEQTAERIVRRAYRRRQLRGDAAMFAFVAGAFVLTVAWVISLALAIRLVVETL